MKLGYLVDRKSSTPLVIVGIVSGIFGILAGPILELWISPFLAYENLASLVFVLIVIQFLSLVAINERSRTYLKSLDGNVKELRHEVGYQVKRVPHEEGLKEILKRAATAKEVLQFTNYLFDWEKHKPVHGDIHFQSAQRERNYKFSIKRILEGHKRGEGKYIRIVSVPEGHSLSEVFMFDPLLRKQCEVLSDASRTKPENWSIRTSECYFQSSFIL